jgi:hypothetical protein
VRFLLLLALCAACSSTPHARSSTPVATVAPEPAEPQPPDDRVALVLDPAGSEVSFLLDAPRERQRATFSGAALSGEASVVRGDAGSARGQVNVELAAIRMEQQRREDGSDAWGEWQPQEIMTRHARAWLEIDDDAPEDARRANAKATFVLASVASGGTEQPVILSGNLVLHGRSSEQRIKAAVTFAGADQLDSVRVETTEPFAVGLAAHDIRPREAFGKLAQKTLEMLVDEDGKLAAAAHVSLKLRFVPRPSR